MKIWATALRVFLMGLLTASAIFVNGCADVSPSPDNRVFLAKATINGRPAKLMLDTGAQTTTILGDSTSRLGLKTAVPAPALTPKEKETGRVVLAISAPAQISLGEGTFTSPLFILTTPWHLRVYFFVSEPGFDGVVGWTSVRDNILLFNPEHLTVDNVGKVPPEAANWQQIKIGPQSNLHWETPLPNGKTGIIIVDTGNPYGVTLAPALWDEWRAAHPQAPSVKRRSWLPSGFVDTFEEAWADEVQIGALKLTDVPVHRATAGQLASKPDDYIGGLGLYALSRMDLVLDGKNSVAYVRPKAPPGLPYPGFIRPGVNNSMRESYISVHWAANNLRVDGSDLQASTLNYLGYTKLRARDFAGAVADFSRALELSPRFGAPYFNRGVARLNLGDYIGAVADLNYLYEKSPAPSPRLKAAHAKLMAGDYPGALADYNEFVDFVQK